MSVIDADAVPSRDAVVIDVVSDVVCPWCYIGKRKLEAALETLATKPCPETPVRWHPFQLNPDLPPQSIPKVYLQAKFGAGRARPRFTRGSKRSAPTSASRSFDRIEFNNTRAARRLIAWAGTRGRSVTNDLVERLFRRISCRAAPSASPPSSHRSPRRRVSAFRRESDAHPAEGLAAVTAEDRGRAMSASTAFRFHFNGTTALSGAHDPATCSKQSARRDGDRCPTGIGSFRLETPVRRATRRLCCGRYPPLALRRDRLERVAAGGRLRAGHRRCDRRHSAPPGAGDGLAELFVVVASIRHTRRNLEQWMAPVPVSTLSRGRGRGRCFASPWAWSASSVRGITGSARASRARCVGRETGSC
jgi:hypothetical protein